MPRSLHAVAMIAFASIALLAACQTAPPPVVTRPVVVPDTTHVAGAADLAALETFDPTTGELRFAGATSLSDLTVGDVLAAPPTAAAPYGFLRMVTAIHREADGVVLETRQAALTEAISQGEIDVEGTLTSDDLVATTGGRAGVVSRALPSAPRGTGGADRANGLGGGAAGAASSFAPSNLDAADVGTSVVSEGYAFEVAFDVELDFDGETDGVEGTGKVRATGVVRFNVGYGIGIGIEACLELPPVCVDRFEARAGIDQYVDLTLSASIEGRVMKEIVLHSFYFDPIVVWLGPVPLVFVPVVDVVVGARGEARATFEFRATESARMVVGAKWTDPDDDGRGWEDLSANNGVAYRADAPTFDATMILRGYGRSDAKLLLYGVTGPSMGLWLGAGVDVQVPRRPLWRIFAHLGARVAFEVDLIVLDLTLYEKILFELEPTIAEASNSAPRFTGVASDAIQADIGVPVNLGPRAGFSGYFDVMDPEGDPFTLTAHSNVDGAIPLTATFTTTGARTVRVFARDDRGASSSIDLVVNVRNGLPIVDVRVPGTTVAATTQFIVSATAFDPETGELGCGSIAWTVTAPDVVTPQVSGGGVCSAVAVFAVEGTRTLVVSATDPHGGTTHEPVSVFVTPAPANRPPVLDPASYSVRAERGPMGPNCITGYWCEVPPSEPLSNGLDGDYYPPLWLSVDATDPEGDPLTVTWSCATGSTVWPVIDYGDGTYGCTPFYVSSASTSIVITVSVSDGRNPPVSMSGTYFMLQRVN